MASMNIQVTTPEAMAKLAGQTVPFKDSRGTVIGTATMNADGTAEVKLDASNPIYGPALPAEWLRLSGGAIAQKVMELYAEPDADAPTIVEGKP